ncbi:MAG: nucleotide pyrophosphohydrolase [Hyphomicrobiales bacterium]|nr:nucleotide pyrophosphohydrolase [Hyphomicrobiales bacterium]
MEASDLQELTQKLTSFRDERSWQQFHSLKELILSLNLEAGELLELTQWQNADEFEDSLKDESVKARLKEEIADVFAYLLLIAERAQIDLVKVTHDKIAQNEKKYPVEKSKGNSTKYTRL